MLLKVCWAFQSSCLFTHHEQHFQTCETSCTPPAIHKPNQHVIWLRCTCLQHQPDEPHQRPVVKHSTQWRASAAHLVRLNAALSNGPHLTDCPGIFLASEQDLAQDPLLYAPDPRERQGL